MPRLNASLRELRQLAGITQALLARESGVDRCRISLAENTQINFFDWESDAVERVLLRLIRERANTLAELLAVKV